MENIIEYKGYYTRVRFDAESKTLRGKDDYLEFCREAGKEPEKGYK